MPRVMRSSHNLRPNCASRKHATSYDPPQLERYAARPAVRAVCPPGQPDLELPRPSLTELDPQNTTPPTALMYRRAVHRPTHAFLPTVTMFWPHSCRLGREIWRSRAGSNGSKLLIF